jgi:hypothetical protein
VPGALTREQLCMAFRATVSCAVHPSRADNGALAWYAVSELLVLSQDNIIIDAERKLKLHHVLMSTVSVLPLGILERVLAEIAEVLEAQGEYALKELSEALYTEIVERVGNAERETVLRWWFEQPYLAGKFDQHEEAARPQSNL